ncbi:MAG: signal recognition particle-docking protein FtsY [Burkholderiales bacterium]|nr:signal recognition particle-docking protein FtsY [Burkholderiales bacterium]OJX00953.1 MAG: signal recognition particle-docking protein FtsY [Burkholderiales bacterium 70-64]
MFGFLRRKRPAASDASPPPTDIAAADNAAGAGAAEAQPSATAIDATASSPPSPAVPSAPPSPATVTASAPAGFLYPPEMLGAPPAPAAPPPPAAPAPSAAATPAAAAPATVAATVAPAAAAMTAAPTATAPSAAAPVSAAPVSAAPASAAPPSAPAATRDDRRGWVARLRQGLSKTRGNLAGLFSNVRVDDALFEELEAALLTSDAGVATTDWLMRELQERVRRQRLTEGAQVRDALRALLVELLRPLEAPVDIDRAEPLVIMIAGVNGAGKTTSIGKLARHLQREGKTVLLAAGDTFRAAAREQLAEWGARNDVEVIAQQGGDPAAVAFDAVNAGRARRTGVVMIDTAGRLPTQVHLMDELKKVRRVVGRAMEGAPHETLLVLDGNTGQNMLAQVKAFDDAIALTGLIVTKLDGTAKGGALAALAFTRRERPIPVYFVGVGEGIDDLQAFSADEFASALID